MKSVILKPDKEKPLLQKHPWIFSGAIASMPECAPGEILSVKSASGKFLAQAYFHPTNSIAGRVLSFEERPILQTLTKRFEEALELRKRLLPKDCTAFRLINAEGDGIPGLVVDLYGKVVVVQATTWGIEKLKESIVGILVKLLSPRSIYEKSQGRAREQEGLQSSEKLLYGEKVSEVEIVENGIKFLVRPEEGQKTGFFLDQREMRALVMRHAQGKKVLNCFSYTGGFSLAALKGGALSATSVDICPDALRLAKRNCALNGFTQERHTSVTGDVFDYLKETSLPFDFVILDPPAFAKKRSDVMNACRGYKEINRLAMQKMPPGSLLLTSSCSHHIDETLFQNLLFQAALEAGRTAKILSHHHNAFDHPLSLYHPEGHYLKSLLLYLS